MFSDFVKARDEEAWRVFREASPRIILPPPTPLSEKERVIEVPTFFDPYIHPRHTFKSEDSRWKMTQNRRRDAKHAKSYATLEDSVRQVRNSLDYSNTLVSLIILQLQRQLQHGEKANVQTFMRLDMGLLQK